MKSQQGSPIFKKAQGLLIQHIGQETLVYSEALHKSLLVFNPGSSAGLAAPGWYSNTRTDCFGGDQYALHACH